MLLHRKTLNNSAPVKRLVWWEPTDLFLKMVRKQSTNINKNHKFPAFL